VVRLLLATGNVDAESKDIGGQTPLSRAGENRREAVVQLLLATVIIDIDSDKDGEIPQSPLRRKRKRR
jgi:ankyrin repeat protein